MRVTLSLLVCVVSLFSSVARAGDAVALQLVRTGQVGTSPPALVLTPASAANTLDVRLRCGSTPFSRTGAAASGEAVRIELPLDIGIKRCSGVLSVSLIDGTEGEMPLDFEVEVLPVLELTVDRTAVDLASGALQLEGSRALGSVAVEVFGLGNTLLSSASLNPVPTPSRQQQIEWSPPEGEIIRLEVKATDTFGFWAGVELSPWFYEIPHEDVVFETGKSVVRDSEAPKLATAMNDVLAVLEKYGADVKLQLFVGGYTDTVGDKASNLQLSERRARAIASWFRAHGFERPIYYQGFGERGLAVQTADEVDEAQNRRAVYIAAAEPPPVTEALPAANWTRLP